MANKLQKVMNINNQLNVTSKEYIACDRWNYYFAVYENDRRAVIAALLRSSKFKQAARAMHNWTFESEISFKIHTYPQP